MIHQFLVYLKQFQLYLTVCAVVMAAGCCFFFFAAGRAKRSAVWKRRIVFFHQITLPDAACAALTVQKGLLALTILLSGKAPVKGHYMLLLFLSLALVGVMGDWKQKLSVLAYNVFLAAGIGIEGLLLQFMLMIGRDRNYMTVYVFLIIFFCTYTGYVTVSELLMTIQGKRNKVYEEIDVGAGKEKASKEG